MPFAAAPEDTPPERHIRRAVERMHCRRGHHWVRMRDATGYVNRECPECGEPAVQARVVTLTLVESPSQETEEQDGYGQMWDEGPE